MSRAAKARAVPDGRGEIHPAKWSQPILDAMAEFDLPKGGVGLDPFAGVGIDRLAEALGRDMIGVELEPEWAGVSPRAVIADALRLPFGDGSVRLVATSCTYANRMADSHDAKEKCKKCRGTGKTILLVHPWGPAISDGTPCEKCDGRGFRSYTRLTYTHQLRRLTGDPERKLHPNNSGALHWGPKYRSFHEQAWAEVWRVLECGGTFVLNVKNHHRDHAVQRVMEWHLNHLVRRGFTLLRVEVVDVKGMGLGQNRDAREPHEFILVFERPVSVADRKQHAISHAPPKESA